MWGSLKENMCGLEPLAFSAVRLLVLIPSLVNANLISRVYGSRKAQEKMEYYYKSIA